MGRIPKNQGWGGRGKDWTKSLKNCQKMNHEAELNVDDCSLSVFGIKHSFFLQSSPPFLF